MSLELYGWDAQWASEYSRLEKPGCIPGRIQSALRGAYNIWTAGGLIEAPARKKLIRDAAERPCTGDWVVMQESPPLVEAVLPRRTRVSRKAPGEATAEQILAANLDLLLIVAGLDRDYNPRRLERYMALAWDSGARPVILLNKADIGDDFGPQIEETRALAGEADVLLVSALSGLGIEAVQDLLEAGKTAAFIGSSGVGKSALTNRLVGQELRAVGDVREADGRGRHTTVGRELIVAPAGWLLMDLPGIREVRPWNESGVEEAFEDVEQIIAQCKFSDCKHGTEPGCAVRQALQDESLERARFDNYLKVRSEMATLDQQRAKRANIEDQKKLRKLHKTQRDRSKRRN